MLRIEYVTVVTNRCFFIRCWVLGIGSLRQFINSLNDPTFFAFRKKTLSLPLSKTVTTGNYLASYEFRIVKSSFTMKIKKMIYIYFATRKKDKKYEHQSYHSQ